MQNKKPLIGIIGGTSQFGQWFKFFFENNGYDCLVASRTTELTSAKLARQADIVIISVPIRETVKVIREIRDLLKPTALLCDFTSLKKEPLKEMLKRKTGGVLGTHPLFGPLVPSLAGQKIIFCKGRNNKWVGFLKKIFQKNGGKIVEMSAGEHDKQMAMIQAMTHFINIVFAKVLQKQKIQPLNIFSTPIFRLQAILMGRILGANPSLYADVEIKNNSFREVLNDFINETNKLSSIVLKKKTKEFENNFSLAARAMKNFIPIAQAKTVEISYLLDKQPVEIKKQEKSYVKIFKRAIVVACLGPEGTYSHLASEEIFSQKADFIMAINIRQVFKIIENNEAEFGVVPAENSTAGVVQETLDCLLDYPLYVVGSYKKEIHHCLLARVHDRSKIKFIRSHIQPLNQCQEWLNKNFPQVILETKSSTTQAILSTDDLSVAFIGSEEAAKKYGLKILERNIEDNKNNTTEFYILSKTKYEKLSKKLNVRRTLLIITVYDRPGVLRDVLSIFADRKLNLTKLHSRTSIVKGWDYYFFLEVECLPDNPLFREAIKEIKKYCSIVRIIGIV